MYCHKLSIIVNFLAMLMTLHSISQVLPYRIQDPSYYMTWFHSFSASKQTNFHQMSLKLKLYFSAQYHRKDCPVTDSLKYWCMGCVLKFIYCKCCSYFFIKLWWYCCLIMVISFHVCFSRQPVHLNIIQNNACCIILRKDIQMCMTCCPSCPVCMNDETVIYHAPCIKSWVYWLQ